MYKSSREIARDMCREIDELKQIIKEKDEKSTRNKQITDKQIIIDDVDVSGCEHLYREIDCLAHIDFSECCEGYDPSYGYCPNIDCYYKQLKRKEQKYEEALDKIKKIAESCITPYGHIFTDEIEQIIEICKITGNNDVVHESLEDRLAKAISNKEFLELLKKYEGKGETND